MSLVGVIPIHNYFFKKNYIFYWNFLKKLSHKCLKKKTQFSKRNIWVCTWDKWTTKLDFYGCERIWNNKYNMNSARSNKQGYCGLNLNIYSTFSESWDQIYWYLKGHKFKSILSLMKIIFTCALSFVNFCYWDISIYQEQRYILILQYFIILRQTMEMRTIGIKIARFILKKVQVVSCKSNANLISISHI